MTPMQAIVAATKNGAFAAGRTEDLGTLEAGKIADLLVLDASPLADIKNIRGIRTLIAGARRQSRHAARSRGCYRGRRSRRSSRARSASIRHEPPGRHLGSPLLGDGLIRSSRQNNS